MRDDPQTKPASIWSKEGQPVPDDHLIICATVVLAKHAGKLTNRRADATMREIIARDWIAQLRRSGYRITFGPEAPPPQHARPPQARAMKNHRLFLVENGRRRIVASARDAGQARTIAAMLLHGSPHAAERDALVVREPEEEERAAFEASRPGPGSDVDLGAIPL